MSAPSLPRREDTFLGVFAGLAEDFGISPTWLRASLGVLIIWQPLLAAAVYLGAGAVVALSRWLVPEPQAVAFERCADCVDGPCTPECGNDNEELALAA